MMNRIMMNSEAGMGMVATGVWLVLYKIRSCCAVLGGWVPLLFTVF